MEAHFRLLSGVKRLYQEFIMAAPTIKIAARKYQPATTNYPSPLPTPATSELSSGNAFDETEENGLINKTLTKRKQLYIKQLFFTGTGKI